MPIVIILRGAAGVGKTTIGDNLAKQLVCNCIHIDKELKKNNLEYIKGKDCVPEENFFRLHDLIIENIENNLKIKPILIIEGNFYHPSQIDDLIKKIDARTILFTLKASLETCIKRDKLRNPLGKDAIAGVYGLTTRFDIGKNIDTENKSIEKITDEIISEIEIK